jgi:hypothetical protein
MDPNMFPIGLASHGGLASDDALPLLLTTESLLFAAFGVSVALTTPVEGGRPPLIASGMLAALISIIIWVVALGAASAWISVYIDPSPCGFSQAIQGLCLAGGIVLQPVIASVIAWNIRAGA